MVLRHIRFTDEQDMYLLNQEEKASVVIRRALDEYIANHRSFTVSASSSTKLVKGGINNG